MSEAIERNLRKTRTGKVVSTKMDKTVVAVSYTHLRAHETL